MSRISPRRVLRRLHGIARPPLTITSPPDGVLAEWNCSITARDGTTLRANVFRPAPNSAGALIHPDGRFPVIMCAHPYGKDVLPKKVPWGYLPPLQYRVFRQPEPITFSAWTGWEGPDPDYWVRLGFAVVVGDLRGFGTSEGIGTMLSKQEGEDYHDLIEWAGTQPWSNGRVGLLGVSYLALSQYRAAAERPPHLAAICPWEGFSDVYRDFAKPGGVSEMGFFKLWSTTVGKQGRVTEDLLGEATARPELDTWWQSRLPKIEDIEVPMLVCGSFSDHLLHTRGSFEAFRRVKSDQKWLYTHRGGKWCTFYGAEAQGVQRRFFERFLCDAENGWDDEPPVRIAIHETGEQPLEIRSATTWPPSDIVWTGLHLRGDGTLSAQPESQEQSSSYANADGSLSYRWTVPQAVDLIGPMTLHLDVSLEGVEDTTMLAAIRLLRDGREVTFEGSYGFAGDVVTHGWLRPAHRTLDQELSTDWQPVHSHAVREPLSAGEIVPISIALLPQATHLRAGDVLELELRSHWLFPANPFSGQMPARYVTEESGSTRIHLGDGHRAELRLPIA